MFILYMFLLQIGNTSSSSIPEWRKDKVGLFMYWPSLICAVSLNITLEEGEGMEISHGPLPPGANHIHSPGSGVRGTHAHPKPSK